MEEQIKRKEYDFPVIDLDYDTETPFKFTRVFEANLLAIHEGNFVIINQGGTSSSKTYSILQVILFLLDSFPGWVCTVCGETLPSLKSGAIRDYETIVGEEPFFAQMIKTFNKGDNFALLKNGSKMEFKAYDDERKAKPGKRDILFVTEINAVKKGIVNQLVRRTKRQVFFDFNADEAFFVHSDYIPRADAKLIISNYRHNRYCPPKTVNEIELLKTRNWNDWIVYGLGKTGKPSNEKPFFVDFDYDTHVVDDIEFNPDFPVLQTWDFNVNPTSVIFIQVIWGKGVYIIQEYQQNGGTQKLLDRHLSDYVGLYMYDIVGDNSGWTTHSASEITDYQLIEEYFNTRVEGATREANKRHIFSRKLCNHILWKVPVFFSRRGCPKLINEVVSAEQTKEGKLRKDDFKHRNDLVDAYRYGMHFLFEDIDEVNDFANQVSIMVEAHEKEEIIEIQKIEEKKQQFKNSKFKPL